MYALTKEKMFVITRYLRADTKDSKHVRRINALLKIDEYILFGGVLYLTYALIVAISGIAIWIENAISQN